MHDPSEHSDKRHVPPMAGRPDEASEVARIESLLAIWAEANAAPPDLADRIFQASRASIAARRESRRSLGERLGELLSLFSPPRLALAALLFACLALPAVLLLDRPQVDSTESLAASIEVPPVVEAALLAEAPVAEPLLVAMLEPVSADWSDVLGHEPGVEILSVIETRGRGLDEYAAEFEAILGAFESAPMGM